MPTGQYNRKPRGQYKQKSIRDRFWSKVNIKGGGCWEWKGAKVDGYGRFEYNGVSMLAHRVAWILIHGKITDGLNICHHCDIRSCCNPAHLFEGTDDDNVQDMVNKGRNVQVRGSRHGKSKLTEQDVINIKAMRNSGITVTDIASIYGVSNRTIYSASTGKTWSHVKGG